jgi:gas vesicle protein
MQKFFSFLAGIFSGLLVGAVSALLLAPMSGEELRTEAQARGNKLVEDIKSAVAEERQRLEEELEALKRGEIQVN